MKTLLLSALAFCATCQNPETDRIAALRAQLLDPQGDVMVIAHRACFKDAPENSIAAIEACIALGVDMIEIDVRKTRDGQLVLLHDDTLDRTTTGHGVLSHIDWAELSDLALKMGEGGEDTPITEETIPTLRQAFAAAHDQILINLDVKDGVHAEALALAREMGVDDQILIKASLPPGDARLVFTQNLGQAMFMPIIGECHGPIANRERAYCEETPSEALAAYESYNPVAYELVFESPALLEVYQSASEAYNRRLWVNTLSAHHAAGLIDERALVDPEGVWGQLIAQGADMIQTDEPEALKVFVLDMD